jgi:hypothetical protein
VSMAYGFRCVACGSTHDLGDRSNHAEHAARTLLTSRAALVALGGIDTPTRQALEVLLGPGGEGLLELARWLHQHAGHDVRLFTEYGEEVAAP